MMLATWLVEFYLSRCNQLDDLIASQSSSNDAENLRTERNFLEDDLRQFFETYKVLFVKYPFTYICSLRSRVGKS
jgi:hypothetical protein